MSANHFSSALLVSLAAVCTAAVVYARVVAKREAERQAALAQKFQKDLTQALRRKTGPLS